MLPPDTSFQLLLIDFLFSHQEFVAYLPVSLHDILKLMSLSGQCSATIKHHRCLQTTCEELSSCLSSFVYNEGMIEFFDIDVLLQWAYGASVPLDNNHAFLNKDEARSTVLAPENELIDLLYETSFSEDRKNEIENLLASDTAQFSLARERAMSKPPKPYIEVCPSSSRNDCLLKGHIDCLKKIHFEKIISSTTDVHIGDCSYLDTCFKGKGCKYVHYQVVYPESSPTPPQGSSGSNNTGHLNQNSTLGFYTNGERMSGSVYAEMPPQWISCDIRHLDLNVLGQFAAIIADPPWDIHMNGHLQVPNGVITDEEILSFRIDQIQTEGIFFLWVTGRALDIGRQCLKKWGYNQVEEILWCKTNQLGRTICTGRTGHWLNHSKEHALMGVKGNPQWLNRGLDADTIVSGTRDKSHKPDELYDIIERLVGSTGRKLELFGREHNIRPQWLTVGNQLDGTRVIEPDVAKRFHEWRTNQALV